MRILTVLTYYRPHTSGLTIYAERLAKALARRGHQVTILTSQFSRELPLVEEADGVRIVRVPVLFRLSKGVIMPTFGFLAGKLVLENDVIQLHLPQFDAAGISLRGRLLRKPTVITYHCDLNMPPGLVSRMANIAIKVANNMTALFTHRIVTYTRDYAEHSSYLHRYIRKLHVIPPPVVLPSVPQDAVNAFNRENNPDNRHPVIGMAARFATEKGVEVLLNALPSILDKHPNLLVLFAGPYKNIIGEEQYFQRLYPIIQKYEQQGHWKFVGSLDLEQMAAYYPNLDIFVLSSLNSTEAFGLVQIEAMINGVPSVASDLPGVRQPVLTHKMGKIIPVGDSRALSQAVLDILSQPQNFISDPQAIAPRYLPDTIAAEYENLFQQIMQELGR